MIQFLGFEPYIGSRDSIDTQKFPLKMTNMKCHLSSYTSIKNLKKIGLGNKLKYLSDSIQLTEFN